MTYPCTESEQITAFAINYFGLGGHPMATVENLHGFTPQYKCACLNRLIRTKKPVTPEAKELAKQARAEIKGAN